MSEPDSEQYKYILSIDIGIHHLAMVLLECYPDYTLHDIIWFELINITTFVHLDAASKTNCSLQHSKTVSDWLSHIFYLHTELFDLCELVLIERQPPTGQIAVEQLFFFQYRKKAKLIHPRSVHTFFGWNTQDLDYNQRKEKSIKIMEYHLHKTNRQWLKTQFNNYTRKHDISDAFIQAIYFLSQYRIQQKQQQNRILPNPLNINLEHFRFNALEIDELL